MPQSPKPDHGYEGPITVSHVSSSGKPRNYPLKSMVEDIYSTAGVHRIEDMNSGKTIGVAEYATSTFNGERQFGAVCYPRGRNVTVWTDTTAARLIIEGTKATGVQLMENERGVQQVRAKKEVIVTCGAQGSPKLLLLR
jgi:choline dehydrogenase-like flavoprotein